MSQGNQKDRTVKTAETVFDVLETIKRSNGVKLQEIADSCGLAKSTAYAHLQTLISNEYVVKQDREYHLGSKFLGYGIRAQRRNPLVKRAMPIVDRLARETTELVWLGAEEYGRMYFIYTAEGERALQTAGQLGSSLPMHSCATGKAILSRLPQDRVDNIIEKKGLEPVTENTIVERDVLYDDLEQSAEQGYAITEAEQVEGVRCIAVPVVVNGSVLGAISIPGPEQRMRGAYLYETLAERLFEATNELELLIRFGPDS